MKKLVLVAVILLGFAALAVAEDTPAAEVFGGYSYVRVNPPSGADVDSINLNGWNGSIAFNGNQWLGFVADFGGYYGSPSADFEGETYTEKVKIHSVMFGPKVSMRSGKITPFFQALFGFANVRAKVESEEVFSENDFAMAFGGGLDFNVGEKIAIRPVQIDYMGVKQEGEFLNNFRYSAGIVFKLGKR